MNKSLFILALVVVASLANLQLEDSFRLFTERHNKQYQSEHEYQYRMKVYGDNLAFIEEHNRMNLGFKVAMNKFGDLTAEEFGALYNGYIQSERSSAADIHVDERVEDLPDSVDWRTKGVVSGVKNQGQCGSCWAFSTVASLEGQYKLIVDTNYPLDQYSQTFSEQQLVDCSGSFGNMGCNGGLMDYGFKYVMSNGEETEQSYPYTARDGRCNYDSSSVVLKKGVVTGYTDVQSQSESALQTAVANVGPISVAIDASHSSFQFYSGGVYYEPSCSSTRLDHGVTAVGYGTETGADYWLVKNSWGTDWGANGYIKMARNRNNNCGIATAASYPLLKK